MNTRPMNRYDLQWALQRLPRQVLQAMKDNPKQVFLAGGFIRAIVANEQVSDIDLFCPNKMAARLLATALCLKDQKVHETDNAFTLKGYIIPVQIIHRWTFDTPEQCLLSFDFSIACACIYHDGTNWVGLVHDSFYEDLAAKRLVYLNPVREEEAGGSMLRVLKFYQRGYRIPLKSMGEVIARMMSGVQQDALDNAGKATREEALGWVLSGLLHEVDPAIDPDHIAHIGNLPEDNQPSQA